jgi:hypothetical protein
MTPSNPLEIQEIVDLVVSYLEGSDVKACIRVSKNWCSMFLSHRWRIINGGHGADEMGNTFPIGPKQNAISDHRHLIQDLSLFNKIGAFGKYQYPNVRSLVIEMNFPRGRHDRLFMNLTVKTPILVDLKLAAVKTPPRFWTTLSKHPHLRHLDLRHILFKADVSIGLWRTCMNLETLRMRYLWMDDGSRPGNVVFGRLRQLRLNTNLLDDTYLDLLLQSPKLESLELEVGGYAVTKERTVKVDWPRLKKLHVSGCRQDTDLEFIFKRVEGGTRDIAGQEPYLSGPDKQTPRIFGSHFGTLVDVNLISSVVISSSTIPDILCLCPRLEKLIARDVPAKSVAERGPWVCQQLRELRIQFLFDASEEDLRQLMFERLSKLTRLERLTLNYNASGGGGYLDVLKFRLDCGLGRLASLQQLNYIWLCSSRSDRRNPDLGMEEVEWILEHWKRLEVMKGCFNREREVRTQLRKVLKSHGIAIR